MVELIHFARIWGAIAIMFLMTMLTSQMTAQAEPPPANDRGTSGVNVNGGNMVAPTGNELNSNPNRQEDPTTTIHKKATGDPYAGSLPPGPPPPRSLQQPPTNNNQPRQ